MSRLLAPIRGLTGRPGLGAFAGLAGTRRSLTQPADVQGAVFDAANDYLTRGAGLTGAVDGPLGMLSFWFRVDGGDGATRNVIGSNAGGTARLFCQLSTSNLLRFTTQSSSGVVVNFVSTQTVLAGSGWHHLVYSWQTNLSAGNKIVQGYLDDVALTFGVATDAGASFSSDYTTTDWVVGGSAITLGTSLFNGALADLYLNTVARLDLTVEANRRAFITSVGAPAYLGESGELPTGTAPILFHRGGAADFPINRGGGGGFTVVGALTDALTRPAD